jgi:hypothetical protein
MAPIRMRLGAMRKATLPLMVLALGLPAPVLAQEAGWHYSPFDGEGDRAALGCAYGSDATTFTCLAVRCEDDLSVGLHIHTSRLGGDEGGWRLDIDGEHFELTARADGAPYHARVEGDVAPLLDGLRNGAVAYLDPATGAPVSRNGISLEGSLYVINQALYFCAPKAPDAPDADAQATR